jgi:hypothetical protein
VPSREWIAWAAGTGLHAPKESLPAPSGNGEVGWTAVFPSTSLAIRGLHWMMIGSAGLTRFNEHQDQCVKAEHLKADQHSVAEEFRLKIRIMVRNILSS